MDRLGFLKRIGILAGASLIPADSILAVTDVIEKKSEPKGIGNNPYKFPLTNHMTIQRKTVSITGDAKSDVVWYEMDRERGKHYYWINYGK